MLGFFCVCADLMLTGYNTIVWFVHFESRCKNPDSLTLSVAFEAKYRHSLT